MEKALEYCIIGTLIFIIITQSISLYFSWKDTRAKCDCPCKKNDKFKENDKLQQEFIKIAQLQQYILFQLQSPPLPNIQTPLPPIPENKPEKQEPEKDKEPIKTN